MTTDVEKCKAILQAVKETNNHVAVTFNYRFNPVHEKVKTLLASGTIGDVISVHFEWLLDTVHGADYFKRWHRQKENSGGLMVHKSGHHFDLVNWWLASHPKSVFGMAKLGFYGDKAGKKHGWAKVSSGPVYRTRTDHQDYERAQGSSEAAKDPFAIHLDQDETLKKMYLDQEQHDGYIRDMNCFAPGIGIEDDMSVLVRYANDAIMTYHLTAYSPWEGKLHNLVRY
jgi:predicted dehydrogenase